MLGNQDVLDNFALAEDITFTALILTRVWEFFVNDGFSVSLFATSCVVHLIQLVLVLVACCVLHDVDCTVVVVKCLILNKGHGIISFGQIVLSICIICL